MTAKRTRELKSRLYHIYMDPDVKDDINRKAEETEPLPDLISNAYYLLGKDWLETKAGMGAFRSHHTTCDDHCCQPDRNIGEDQVQL